MRIEFLGASMLKQRKHVMLADENGDVANVDKSLPFVDLILDHYDAESLNAMIPQIAEERILYNLKKTSNVDIAIIFHSTPKFVYFPNFSRDYIHLGETERSYFPTLTFVKDYRENLKDKVSAFEAKVEVIEHQNSYMSDMMDITYNSEVNKNRYEGALTLINDYVHAKKIPTIHILPNNHSIPHWFKFKSGIVDSHIWVIDKDHKSSFSKTVNAIDKEGNIKIYNLLVKYIDLLINHREYFENNIKFF